MALPSDWGSDETSGPLGTGAGIFGLGGGNIAAQLQGAGVNPYSGAVINQGAFNQWQSQQLALANTLQNQAQGGGPSAAGAVLAAGSNAAASNAMANANSGIRYGTNAAQGAYQAARNAASATSGAANQATQLRANEQLAAQNTLAGVTATGGAQTAQMAQAQAGLSQQAQLAQQQMLANAYMGQYQTNTQGIAGILGGAVGGASSGIAKAAMSARGAVVTHPVLTHLGEHGPEMVIPLKKGTAPYRPGPLASHVTPHPKMTTMPKPKASEIEPTALARLAGRMPPAPPQPGVMQLSPGAMRQATMPRRMSKGGIAGMAAKHAMHPMLVIAIHAMPHGAH